MLGNKPIHCTEKNETQFTRCGMGVEYLIPYTRGKNYNGETGRYINEWLKEHANSVRTAPSGHLAHHAHICGCNLVFQKVSILESFRGRQAREVCEAYCIKQRCETCVSEVFIALLKTKILFLGRVFLALTRGIFQFSLIFGSWFRGCKGVVFLLF